jgi:hypothetical protein
LTVAATNSSSVGPLSKSGGKTVSADIQTS